MLLFILDGVFSLIQMFGWSEFLHLSSLGQKESTDGSKYSGSGIPSSDGEGLFVNQTGMCKKEPLFQSRLICCQRENGVSSIQSSLICVNVSILCFDHAVQTSDCHCCGSSCYFLVLISKYTISTYPAPFPSFQNQVYFPDISIGTISSCFLVCFFFSSASHSELLSRFDVYKVFSAPLNFINLLTWNSEINFHYPL